MTQDLAALVAQVTPGPWKNRGPATASTRTFHVHSAKGCRASVYGMRAQADADLIAKAPDLARTVLEQQAEIARLRDAIEKAEQQADYGKIDACRRILTEALQRKEGDV